MTSVSICIPAWQRAKYLPKTLDSITRSLHNRLVCYGVLIPNRDVEVCIAESGFDGETQQIAKGYNAKYISMPRDEYPAFQSIAGLWNASVDLSSNDVVILQCGEIVHENDVVSSLVAHLESHPHSVAVGVLKNLGPDGQFVDWYNHPTLGSRPGWVCGSGPIAIWRKDFDAIGGFEEMFYGYGHEDDYFFHLFRLNGFSVDYVTSAVCGHQDHPRVPFEPITSQANRCLIRTLWHELGIGERQPFANREPLRVRDCPSKFDLDEFMRRAIEYGAKEAFSLWAVRYLADLYITPEDTFQIHRTCANEVHGPLDETCEMLAESAWAIMQKDLALSSAACATGNWRQRCLRSAEIMGTWAAVALERAVGFEEKVKR